MESKHYISINAIRKGFTQQYEAEVKKLKYKIVGIEDIIEGQDERLVVSVQYNSWKKIIYSGGSKKTKEKLEKLITKEYSHVATLEISRTYPVEISYVLGGKFF